MKILTVVAVLVAAACCACSRTTADGAANVGAQATRAGAFFDVHLHYHHLASDAYTPEQVIGMLDAAGIQRARLSSYPNENTHRLYDLAPSRFVLGVMPMREFADRPDWFQKPECVKAFEDELAQTKVPYCVAGELIVRRWQDIDHPGVRRVVALAKERKLPLHVTTGPEGVRKLFAQYPEAAILLAHAGKYADEPTEGPDDLAHLLDAYPNLSIDLTESRGANWSIAPNGILDPAWRKLVAAYSDRFVIGTDFVKAEHWAGFQKSTDEIRGWLAQLPPDVAEKVAFSNAERFFAACPAAAAR